VEINIPKAVIIELAINALIALIISCSLFNRATISRYIKKFWSSLKIKFMLITLWDDQITEDMENAISNNNNKYNILKLFLLKIALFLNTHL
jgi:hypothetical protein